MLDQARPHRLLARNLGPLFALLVVLWVAYISYFIWRTSFILDGERYFVLFDDMMISMRYARHLAEGYGLVWNVGEQPVEGFSNPLWVSFMAGLHLLGITASKIGLGIQCGAAVCLLLNLLVVKKIADAVIGGSRGWTLAAVAMTAFYYPLNRWSVVGTEVAALTLVGSLAIWRVLKCLSERRFDPWLHLLVGLGTLVRIDALLLALVVEGLLLAADREHRRRNLRWAVASLAFFMGGQTAARLAYFGDWLPNTYYLKMTGYPVVYRVLRGCYISMFFLWRLNWVLVAFPFLIWLRDRNRFMGLLLLVFASQLAYSTYVGGDAWESYGGANRYLCVGMPALLTAFVCALARAAEGLRHWWLGSRLGERLGRYLVLLVFVLSWATFNVVTDPMALAEVVLLNQSRFGVNRKDMLQVARALEAATLPQARLAVFTAGVLPYFCERPVIDLLGRNDRRLAREPMHTPGYGMDRFLRFYPGHMKWDYEYSIGELQPDVVVQVWKAGGVGTEEAKGQLGGYEKAKIGGIDMYVRRGSSNIRWELISVDRPVAVSSPTRPNPR